VYWNQKVIPCPEKESESHSTPEKVTRKPFYALKRFLGSERPIGLVQKLVYRAPKKRRENISATIN